MTYRFLLLFTFVWTISYQNWFVNVELYCLQLFTIIAYHLNAHIMLLRFVICNYIWRMGSQNYELLLKITLVIFYIILQILFHLRLRFEKNWAGACGQWMCDIFNLFRVFTDYACLIRITRIWVIVICWKNIMVCMNLEHLLRNWKIWIYDLYKANFLKQYFRYFNVLHLKSCFNFQVIYLESWCSKYTNLMLSQLYIEF